MQAAAARVAGRSRLQPVLRGLAFAAGLAARAATRAVEHFARRQALVYATGEITLADSPTSCYLTATFEDVDVPPEPDRRLQRHGRHGRGVLRRHVHRRRGRRAQPHKEAEEALPPLRTYGAVASHIIIP